jgi:NAD(P)-dependent dehydrogenase (short-subunit alcohol dehydrogenase family)
MAKYLEGKSAVVTGSGSPVGVGREIAMALAAEGAKVVVNDIGRDSEGFNADKVVNEINKNGGTAVANYDSVTTMQGGMNIIKTAVNSFGSIDILVNCAGNVRQEPLLEVSEEQWDAVVNVHLRGHFFCCKAAALEMVKQNSGRIINFSSRAVFSFGGGGIAYSVAKAGILGLTSSMTGELKNFNITVNAILPSAVTSLFPTPRTSFGGGLTQGPEYIAPIIVYLATDEAQYITGQFIYSSGGDICVYNRPLQLPGPHMFFRKMGKWTIDELRSVMPYMMDQKGFSHLPSSASMGKI